MRCRWCHKQFEDYRQYYMHLSTCPKYQSWLRKQLRRPQVMAVG
jgi:hypothetical protein